MTFKAQPATEFLGGRISAPNEISAFKGYHLSYNTWTAWYESDTTALVIGNNIFFILNGDHRAAMESVAACGGLIAALEYFAANKAHVNKLSEHRQVLGIVHDSFGLVPMFAEAVSSDVIDILKTVFDEAEQ